MSSQSSSIICDDLDVDEGAIIQSVQPSIYEFVNPSIKSDITPVLSESPDTHQKTSNSLYKAILIEKRNTQIISFEELSPVHKEKLDESPSNFKNFVKKNIKSIKNKKNDPNIDGVNISELCLEEEKRELIDVDERFYKYQNKVKEKIQNLAKEKKEKEMQSCTFKPDVITQGQRRTTDQFINQMMSYEKLKNDKIEALRSMKKEENEDEGQYQPIINPKSKEILAKKGESSEPIFEKLYKIASKKVVKETSPPKQIIKKPAKKPEAIDKTLYEDTVKKVSKKVEQKPIPKETQINPKSQQVLAKKFTKEFSEILSALSIGSENIDRDSMIKILHCLNFIRNNPEHPKFEEENSLIEKFIRILEENTNSLNFLKICLCVLNIYTPDMTVSLEKSESQQFGVFVDSNFSVTKDDVLRIHKVFISFYENRQLSTQIIKQLQGEEFSFKPRLNPGTESLAKEVQKRAGSLFSQKREEYLQEEKKKTQEKIEKIKKEKEEKEAKDCTFRPNIKKSASKTEIASDSHRTLSLYEKSKDIKEKKEQQMKTLLEQEIEKNMNECTFAPKIEKAKIKENNEILYSKSVQQQLLRMQKARDEQERKKNILERKFCDKPLSFAVDQPHKSKSAFKPPLSKPRQNSPSKGPLTSLMNEKIDEFESFKEKMNDYNKEIKDYKEKIEDYKEQNYEDSEEEDIQLEVKMPDGSQKTLLIPSGTDKELKISMFILENKLNEELGQKLRKSLLNR